MGLERAAAQVTGGMSGALVLGGSGFVGLELVRTLGWPGTSSAPRDGFSPVDATHREEVERLVDRLRPEVVVNCVGLADVDRSEREPELAARLNHDVVENLVAAQQRTRFRLVQISTDYVFDGVKGHYVETDMVHPINEYGRTKLAGEQSASRCPAALIVRISSPFGRGFGARKPQFFRYVADTLRAGRPVRALTDQTVTATYLPDLAAAITTLLDREVEGIVHVSSEEALTRFEFARRVARLTGSDEGLVSPGVRADMAQWTAPRPSDTSLDVSRSRSLGVSYTPVNRALRAALTE